MRSNISGTTPLIVAAEQNSVAVAELLIARGADLTVADRDGYDALSQAWAKKRAGMVMLLKQHGAVCQPVAVLGSEAYYEKLSRRRQLEGGSTMQPSRGFLGRQLGGALLATLALGGSGNCRRFGQHRPFRWRGDHGLRHCRLFYRWQGRRRAPKSSGTTGWARPGISPMRNTATCSLRTPRNMHRSSADIAPMGIAVDGHAPRTSIRKRLGGSSTASSTSSTTRPMSRNSMVRRARELAGEGGDKLASCGGAD